MNMTALRRFLLIAPWLITPAGLADPMDDAEKDRLRAELEQTQEEIQRLSEKLADLSVSLIDEDLEKAMERVHEMDLQDRALLGVVLTQSNDDPVMVSAVTPDGPADRAGIRTGDAIVALDGARIARRNGQARIIDFMSHVEPGETVAVTVDRNGREREYDVVTVEDELSSFSFSFNDESFTINGEEMAGTIGNAIAGAFEHFEMSFFDGVWPDLEVVELSAGLGDYFGVSEGLLVVSAPKDSSVDLRDGDVIVEVDGEPLVNHRDLYKVIGKRDEDDTVALKVVRQRQTLTVNASVPRGSALNRMGPNIFIHRMDDDEHHSRDDDK